MDAKIPVSLTNDEWAQVIAALEVCKNPLAQKVLECIINAAPVRPAGGKKR